MTSISSQVPYSMQRSTGKPQKYKLIWNMAYFFILYYNENLHYHTWGYLRLHQGVSAAAQTLSAFSYTHGYVRHMHSMAAPMELPGPSGLTAGCRSKQNTLGVSQTAPDAGYWFQPPCFGLVSEFRFRHLMLETNLVSALQSMGMKSLKWVKPWEPLLTPRADTYMWLAEPWFDLPGQQWQISSETTPPKSPETKLIIITQT